MIINLVLLYLLSANLKLIIMGNIKNLEVWKDAKDLAVYTYKITNSGLLAKDFGLRDQIRRAAISVPSNIAEGEESGRTRKGINYFFISKGSLAELLTQIIVSNEVEYIDKATLDDFEKKINSLSAKLRKLIQYREKHSVV
jgi:four helix bundle protein